MSLEHQNATGALTIAEFVTHYGIGRTRVYQLINAGQLRVRKCGRRTLILTRDAEAWAANLPEPERVCAA